MIKENTIAVAGRVSGIWNNNTKSFEIKSGVTKNGKKYQVFEISVAKKDGEKWVNGKGLKVMMWGETEITEKEMIGVVGRLQPDNFTTNAGVEVRGMMINAFDNEMFTPEAWSTTSQSANGKEVAGKKELVMEDVPF